MTTINLKSEILDDLERMIETDKEIIIDAVIKGDNKKKETFVNEYIKHKKMYDLLFDINWVEFQAEITE